MKRLALGCLAALAALPLSAAIHEFSPTDKIQFRSEPKGYESLVVVSQETGRVVFDCRAAFAKGMQNLVCELPAFEDPALAGDDVLFEALAGSLDVQGQVRIYVQMWKELDGKRLFHVLKTKNPFITIGRGGALTRCVGADALPAKSGGYRLRFDFNKPSGKGGIYCFAGGRVARMADVRVSVTPKKVKPELTMYLPFDGTAKAAVARGRAEPLAASGVTYAPGLKGSAARISRADKTFLEYAFTSNVSQVRGSISMWVKRDDWQAGGGRGREWLFTTPTPFDLRMGTGALYLWFWETATPLSTTPCCWTANGTISCPRGTRPAGACSWTAHPATTTWAARRSSRPWRARASRTVSGAGATWTLRTAFSSVRGAAPGSSTG